MKKTGKTFLAKQLLLSLVTIFFVMTLNFVLIRAMPGDPLERHLGTEDYYYLERHHPEDLEEYRTKFGLDESVAIQYVRYVSNIMQGDWGYSYHYSADVLDIILFHVKWSVLMMLPAVLISAVLGIVGGTVAGWNESSWFDRITNILAKFIYVIPTYCSAMVLLLIFSYYNNWFPIGGGISGSTTGVSRYFDIAYHMVLPTVALCLGKTSYNHLIMKHCILEEANQDYAIVASSRGLSRNKVLFRHVLPNSILPMIVNIAQQFGGVISGAMMVEIIFNWQGMGSLIYQSILNLDYPLLQGCLLVTTIMVIISNIVADVVCYLIDPRIRDGVLDEN